MKIIITGSKSHARHVRDVPLDKEGRERTADAVVQFLGIKPKQRRS